MLKMKTWCATQMNMPHTFVKSTTYKSCHVQSAKKSLEGLTTLFEGRYLNSSLNKYCMQCILAAVISGASTLVPTKKVSFATAAEKSTHSTLNTRKCFMVYPTQCMLIYSSPIVQI